MANAIPVHAPDKPEEKKPLSKDAQKIKKELSKAVKSTKPEETPKEDPRFRYEEFTLGDGTKCTRRVLVRK